MHKTTRSGFTLVEMVVVMAIMAILSMIGVAVLINLKNGSTVDNATQEIVSSIREAQNKAVSVANAPSGAIPLAWGVQIYPAAKTVEPFYVDSTYQKRTFQTASVYSSLSQFDVGGDSVYLFTAPFGKYYSAISFPDLWTVNDKLPRDSIPTVVTSPQTDITLTYKTSTNIITIQKNGDVYVH